MSERLSTEAERENARTALHALFISADKKTLDPTTLEGAHMRDIASSLHELSLLSRTNDSGVRIEHENNIWLYPVKIFLKFLWPFKAMAMARRQLAWQGTFRPHLVVAGDTLGSGFAALQIANRFKKRLYVVCPEDTFTLSFRFSSIKNFFLSYLSRYVLERATLVEVPTAYIEGLLLTAIPALVGRTVIIAPFIDIERITALKRTQGEPLKLEGTFFRMISPGPLVAPLRHDIAINVLDRISGTYGKTGLIFSGTGPERAHLEALARKKGLSKKVIFVSPETNPMELYNFSHVALMPSDQAEGGEEALIALALSCPVVASSVPLVEKTFGNLKYKHFICPRGDIECFVSRVRELMDNPGVREDYKLNARDMISQNFTRTRADYVNERIDSWMKSLSFEIV